MSPALIHDAPTPALVGAPLTIRMHESDNVVIVANDGGLPAGTTLPSGLVLYIFVNTMLSLAQQLLIQRKHGAEPVRA